MNKCSLFVAALIALFTFSSDAAAQLRIVNYNTAMAGVNSGPTTPRNGMDVVLEAIGNEPTAGIVKPMDVLTLQEQASSAGSTQAMVDLLNGIYGSGTYQRATLDGATWGGGRPGLIYNTQTVQLLQQNVVGSLSNQGAVRQALRYKLRPLGYGSGADFYVYSSHYKAGDTATDRNRRQVEAQAVRANADSLGADAHVIYAGDFNIQSSSEAMYQTLLAAGPGQAFDPINRPGTWNNNSSFRNLHTQSPYDPGFNDGSLITGGMDDRFDFQLVSAALRDGEGLNYIPGTYHVFGNNGSHGLNDSVNDPSNTAQPQPVLDALAAASDHLPVVADYQLPAAMSLALADAPDRVIVGADVPVRLDVWNSANVVAANGADQLDYVVTTSGSLNGSYVDSDAALGGVNTHILQLDAETPGVKVGLAIVSSSSPAAANPTDSRSLIATVVDHANASLADSADVDALAVDFGIVAPGSGVATQTLGLHNRFAASGFTAGLDLDAVLGYGDTGPLALDLEPFSNLAVGASVAFDARLDASASGAYSSTWVLQLSDEDIPGIQLPSTLTLTLSGGVAIPGDANLDGVVDGSDFNLWNANKFLSGTSWTSADFNFDGVTDGSDFNIWNAHKFSALGNLGGAVPVPEPSALMLGAVALLVLRRGAALSGYRTLTVDTHA